MIVMKTAFVFAGQGAQSVGMGKDLYDRSPSARKIFDEADSILGWSVTDVCFNGPAEKLTGSRYCQPAIYTVSMACLAGFLERFPGFLPCAAAGLSLGEYSAMACSQVFSFADGLRLVAKRGELMDKACREKEGGMASIIGLAPEIISEVCAKHDIDVANFNCPGQIVISGPVAPVTAAAAELKEKGARRAVPLNVAGAFHSRLMKSAGDALGEVLKDVDLAAPRIPVAQNFTGTIVSSPDEIRTNLKNQVAGSVRWDSCVRTIAKEFGADTFVEFGPGSVLSGLIRRIDPALNVRNISGMDDIERYE
jgi:[acyl-carrier-protein] S-malonyltransferase